MNNLLLLIVKNKGGGVVKLNIDNRRLREVQSELIFYHKRLDEAETKSESLIYQGKIEILEREEREILARYDVIT